MSSIFHMSTTYSFIVSFKMCEVFFSITRYPLSILDINVKIIFLNNYQIFNNFISFRTILQLFDIKYK